MRIIVTGGGTGGHIFPALEIVKAFEEKEDTIEVIFVGNKESLEEKMAKARNIPFYGLAVKKILGQGGIKKMLALIFLQLAIIKSLWFLIKHRPHAVVGVGGYVSAPMLLASFLLGIKGYICEQNVVPGLANRYLSKIAQKIFISFAESKKFFPKEKVVLSGNPIRHEFFLISKTATLGPLKILITGGSLGARTLNTELPLVLAAFGPSLELEITHQTGAPMQQEVRALYKKLNLKANVVSFIENMPEAFSKHDLLISRAGATVCAEIMAAGMPAILVPYRFAQGHQRENAQALVKADAGLMVEEEKDFKENLRKNLSHLYHNRKALDLMGKNAKNMAKSDATFIITTTILQER